VALEMKRLGFTRVQPLLGGLNGWLERKYPVIERSLVASA
jgi:rhodanese-related sulfurtransferase